ncbi:MAG: lytic transglycosylase domain-containing protein [Treponema sp.]|nr:lytic transglycosylase domain-containing protein [Treponema sp.]
MALRAADKKNEKEAIRLFTLGRKKSNDLTRRKCAEALTQLGNLKERREACKFMIANWQDEAALETVCTEFDREEEYSSVISCTDSLDLATASNNLVRLRMLALYAKADSRFANEVFFWMTRRALSSQHLEIYNRFIALEHQDSEETPLSLQQQIMAYRVLVYRRSYATAYSQIAHILELCDDNLLDTLPLIISDMGKAAMYGSLDFYNAARIFDKIVSRTAGESAFYANFYAGRLFDKAGRYPTYAVSRFTAAMDASTTESQYDNALWYLFNTQLRTSTNDILASLNTFGGTWHNASYFDDFFESLSVLLISHQEWQEFYNVWKAIDSTASEDTASKYAYISGRLIEEGLATDTENAPTRLAVAAFSRVLSGSGSLYYKVCALERMNILDENVIESTLSAAATTTMPEFNKDAELFLQACAAFGFPQKIYPEWLQYRTTLHTESALQISQFLSQCASGSNNYGVQSLRIAARATGNAYEKLPKALLYLNYPRLYADFVQPAAREYEVTEPLLYALIRSESFFDAEVSSSSGAQGLTQLMDATASDIARKLRYTSYNILDPETNIRFGSYYLAELISRTDNLPLLAILAYNAGLTNVRRWVRQTSTDWLMNYKSRHPVTGISLDLFLETLPFAETREYGRKIISAAALYGWLYYGKTPAETVRQFL